MDDVDILKYYLW